MSIGIPTYNRPDGLRQLLECFINNSYKNLQIIISDNNSEIPDVRKVAEEYAFRDKRINYYRQNINIGAISNFQFVLEKAEGEYFMWAADDDLFSLNYIESNLNMIQSNDCFIGSFGRIINSVSEQTNENEINKYNYINRYRRIRKQLRNPAYNICFYSLFKTSVIRKINLLEFNYYAFDWFMIAYLLRFGIIANTTDSNVNKGDEGLSSDQFFLINYFYRDSWLRYFPFVKPAIKYFTKDFFSAFINLDILFYYNLYYANFAWDKYKPGRFQLIRRVNKGIMSLLDYYIYFADKYIFNLLKGK